MFDALKARYRAFEQCKLAALPQHEREDIVAFDALFRRRIWYFVAAFALLWLLAAWTFLLVTPRATPLEAAWVTLLLLFAMAFSMTSAWFGHNRFRAPALRTVTILVGLTVLGAFGGAFIGRLIAGKGQLDDFAGFLGTRGQHVAIAGLVTGLVYAMVIIVLVHYRRKQLGARYLEAVALAREERLARQLTDARLKLMQAQVEPHFLFNTLGSARQLCEGRAPEAAQLIGQLITFLRAGAGSFRGDSSTLGAELDLALAYLGIMRTRMGARLEFEARVDPALRALAMPPAILISLVENAIKHGIEPSPAGGTIAISAQSDGAMLRLAVVDTGLGLSGQPGAGLGLSNIRERLAALYGAQGTLDLEANVPQGFRALLSLPLGAAPAAPPVTGDPP